MSNEVRVAASLRDDISDGLARIRDHVDRMGSGMTSASLIGNAGAKVLEAGFGLVRNAIGNVNDFIGDSIDAYRQEQVSIEGLNAALAANVEGWSGNTDAIESVIAAREKLAFSDDSQREALKILVAVTGDATQALDAQGVAMDLARFRGIDLATASTLVAKAWDGNTTSLKKLGIQVDAGAKGYEALAAITKVVGGAAEKYAETDLGKVEAAHIRVDDLMEKLGKTFSQISAAVIPPLAEGVEHLVESLTHSEVSAKLAAKGYEELSNSVKNTPTGFDVFGQVLGAVIGQLDPTAAATRRVGEELDKLPVKTTYTNTSFATMADDIGRRGIILSGNVRAASSDINLSLKTYIDAQATKSSDTWADAMRKISDSSGATRDKIVAAMKSLISDAYDPLITAAQIATTKLEIEDTKKALSASELTALEKAQLDERLLNQQKHLEELQVQQAGYAGQAAAAGYAQNAYTAEQILAGMESKDPDVRKHWEALAQAQLDANAEIAVVAYDGGAAQASNLAQGMADHASEWQNQAANIMSSLEGLRPNGWPVGEAWIGSLVNGVYDNMADVQQALDYVNNFFSGESPPPKGPLHTIDRGARNVGKAWVEGLADGIDASGVTGALSRISGLMSAGIDAPGLAVASGAIGSGGASGEMTIVVPLTLDGREVARAVAQWNRRTSGASQYIPA